MTKQNKKHIGKVLNAHGIRGDIYCIVFSGDTTWISKTKSLNLGDESFEILKIKAFKKGFIATLSGFTDRNKAEEYKGSEVWADASLFVSANGEAIYLNELISFKVIDKILGDIGLITAFSSNSLQDLLVISHNSKSFEIPFVKDFIINIDFEKKEILTQLPEGLLEINEPDTDD